jgi:hypothetical protein
MVQLNVKSKQEKGRAVALVGCQRHAALCGVAMEAFSASFSGARLDHLARSGFRSHH